jgi:hypothetical protein
LRYYALAIGYSGILLGAPRPVFSGSDLCKGVSDDPR